MEQASSGSLEGSSETDKEGVFTTES